MKTKDKRTIIFIAGLLLICAIAFYAKSDNHDFCLIKKPTAEIGVDQNSEEAQSNLLFVDCGNFY